MRTGREARRSVGAPGIDGSVRWLASLLLAMLALAPSDGTAQTVPDGLGNTWIRSVEEVLRQPATMKDIDRLTFLYSADVLYEHPRVGVRIRGRDQVAEAMAEFLGETRNPDIDVRGSTTGEGVVVIDYTLEMEMRTEAGWRKLERHQVTVLEVTADGRIRRILEYW